MEEGQEDGRGGLRWTDGARHRDHAGLKAIVDTGDVHGNFWKVTNFLQGCVGLSTPGGSLQLMAGDEAHLALRLHALSDDAAVRPPPESGGAPAGSEPASCRIYAVTGSWQLLSRLVVSSPQSGTAAVPLR